MGTFQEVFLTALRLGLTSFGGPLAHIGYFRREYVERRLWLSEGEFADLVAFCQLLPGPTSSQVGMAIGLKRAGISGLAGAFLGFTLPSAILMIGFAALVHLPLWPEAWMHGLKLVALAVVAHAAFFMARSLIRTRVHAVILVFTLAALWTFAAAWMQFAVIGGAGLAGALLGSGADSASGAAVPAISKRAAMAHIAVFFLVLFFLPWAASVAGSPAVTLADIFMRAGSFVFGGGHVVLPLLQKALVEPGLMNSDRFLAGYSAAQALPGPLFSFAGFAGMEMGGFAAAIVCLAAIFLPGYLLLMGLLPFWQSLRSNERVRGAAGAVNASVVGLIAFAVYDPLWTSAVFSAPDAAAAGILLSLTFLRVPSLLIVVGGLLLSSLLSVPA